MIKPKPVKERDTLDLLELVCQLHSRSLNIGTKEMHDAYVEARQELESRIVANNNFVLAPVSRQVCTIGGECKSRGENNECKGTAYCGYKKHTFC